MIVDVVPEANTAQVKNELGKSLIGFLANRIIAAFNSILFLYRFNVSRISVVFENLIPAFLQNSLTFFGSIYFKAAEGWGVLSQRWSLVVRIIFFNSSADICLSSSATRM